MAFFPGTSHATNYEAVTAFINKCIAAGYTPNSALDVQSALFSVVANMLASGQVVGLRTYSSAQSPAQVAANTTAEQSLTVTGLTTSDKIVSVSKPTAQAGLGIVGWRVVSANTLGLTFSNNTGSPITPTAAETYTVIVATP